ncbi:MAG: type II toxin-antitoxin system PemK/MazF family toxin [Acidimicrobiales bacterium]
MTPRSGEIWRADLGTETRQSVYVISEDRFHQLAERALVAPVLPVSGSGNSPPWWVSSDSSVVALERLSSIPVTRLLDRERVVPHATARAIQQAIGWLTGSGR